jgi:endonuclease/exonuclease/phosphatase family metal-dependent hydrolase
MNYVFATEFEELSQGNGNRRAFHGQATFSRMALSESRVLRFNAQSNFWAPRWFLPNTPLMQRRSGGRMALLTEIIVKQNVLVVYNIHLESRGENELRRRQTHEVLQDARQYGANTPILLAGDFNCDLTNDYFFELIHKEKFEHSFAGQRLLPTTQEQPFRKSRIIDWMLHRGSLAIDSAAVHTHTPGSDHYPLTLTIRLR